LAVSKGDSQDKRGILKLFREKRILNPINSK
jgi:hypothetical protein